MGASNKKTKRSAPARTLEAEENRLIALANKVAEEQMLDGTVTSQVLTHFLKQGTIRAQVELEKLVNENQLLRAKREALASAIRIEDLYAKAIDAMKSYSGSTTDEGVEDLDD